MKTFSPFGKGYKSTWWHYPSVQSLCRPMASGGFKRVLPTCGCDNCRMQRRKAENFPEYAVEAAE